MADDLSPYREQMFALYLRITPRRGVAKLAAQLVRQYIKPDQGRAVVLEALSYALKVEVDVEHDIDGCERGGYQSIDTDRLLVAFPGLRPGSQEDRAVTGSDLVEYISNMLEGR